MDLTSLAAELLDGLPANRTLGLTVVSAVDGVGVARMPVSLPVTNIIGALHSSGIAALADAAALAAVLSAAPDVGSARRLQPLGTAARLTFRRPVRGVATARCQLDAPAWAALAGLGDPDVRRAVFTTVTVVDGDDEPDAARGEFDWTMRLVG